MAPRKRTRDDGLEEEVVEVREASSSLRPQEPVSPPNFYTHDCL